MKFVQAQQPHLRRDVTRHQCHRFFVALMGKQRLVNFLHETVEMHALFADVRHVGKKMVHQETFTAADPATQINTTNHAVAGHKIEQAARLLSVQIGLYPLQFAGGHKLRGIGREAVLCGALPQEGGEIGGSSQ